MSYHAPIISPSALAATEHCPRFRPADKENDAAIEGTLVHEAAESLVQQPRETWDSFIAGLDVSDGVRAMLRCIAEAYRGLIQESECPVFANFRLRMRGGVPRKSRLRPGLYPECEVERGPGRHGFIDLMYVTPEGLVYIIDLKTNRVEKDFSLQLAAYACDVNRLCPVHDAFVCQIIAPRLDDEAQMRLELSPDDLRQYRARIAEIERKADWSSNDDSIPGRPGDQCQYCRYSGICKFQAEDAVAVVRYEPTVARLVQRGIYAGEPLTSETFRSPATPAQRGLRRAVLKSLEAMIDAMKDGDKEWVRLNPTTEVPGWKVSFAKGRSVLDKTRMKEIRQAIMSRFGFTPEELADVSTVDAKLLEENLVTVCGYTKKAAAEEVKRCLEPFSAAGSPVLRWTQVRDLASDVDAEFVDVTPKETIGN